MAWELEHGMRGLFWGLMMLLIFFAMIALSTIGRLASPPAMSSGTPLLELPPLFIAANATIFLLPLVALFLTVAALRWLHEHSFAVARNPTWGIGPVTLSPLSIVVLFLASAVLSLIFGGIMAVASPVASVFTAVVFSASFTFLGWFLMFAAARALEPFAAGRERLLLRAAVVQAFFFVSLLVGAQAVATRFFALELASNPEAVVPPFVPWAEVPAVFSGLAALSLVLWIAGRIRKRPPLGFLGFPCVRG